MEIQEGLSEEVMFKTKPPGEGIKLVNVGCEKAWRWAEAVGRGRAAGQEVWEVETAGGRESGILGTSFEPLK